MGCLRCASLLPSSDRGREACNSHSELASHLRDVGLKESDSRTEQGVYDRVVFPRRLLVLFVFKEGLHKFIVDCLGLFLAVQSGEDLFSILYDDLHEDQAKFFLVAFLQVLTEGRKEG